jgi:hypothetical protein
MPFSERPPRRNILVGGSIARSANTLVLTADRSRTFIAASGIRLLQSDDD